MVQYNIPPEAGDVLKRKLPGFKPKEEPPRQQPPSVPPSYPRRPAPSPPPPASRGEAGEKLVSQLPGFKPRDEPPVSSYPSRPPVIKKETVTTPYFPKERFPGVSLPLIGGGQYSKEGFPVGAYQQRPGGQTKIGGPVFEYITPSAFEEKHRQRYLDIKSIFESLEPGGIYYYEGGTTEGRMIQKDIKPFLEESESGWKQIQSLVGEWDPKTRIKVEKIDEGEKFSVEFPYAGAEYYKTYKEYLESGTSKSQLTTFAMRYTPEDPFGVKSAIYEYTGQPGKALQTRIEALHRSQTVRKGGIPEHLLYMVENPIFQMGAIAGVSAGIRMGASYLAGRFATAPKVILGGKLIGTSVGVGMAGLAAYDVQQTWEKTGDPAVTLSKAGVYGSLFLAAHGGFKAGKEALVPFKGYTAYELGLQKPIDINVHNFLKFKQFMPETAKDLLLNIKQTTSSFTQQNLDVRTALSQLRQQPGLRLGAETYYGKFGVESHGLYSSPVEQNIYSIVAGTQGKPVQPILSNIPYGASSLQDISFAVQQSMRLPTDYESFLLSRFVPVEGALGTQYLQLAHRRFVPVEGALGTQYLQLAYRTGMKIITIYDLGWKPMIAEPGKYPLGYTTPKTTTIVDLGKPGTGMKGAKFPQVGEGEWFAKSTGGSPVDTYAPSWQQQSALKFPKTDKISWLERITGKKTEPVDTYFPSWQQKTVLKFPKTDEINWFTKSTGGKPVDTYLGVKLKPYGTTGLGYRFVSKIIEPIKTKISSFKKVRYDYDTQKWIPKETPVKKPVSSKPISKTGKPVDAKTTTGLLTVGGEFKKLTPSLAELRHLQYLESLEPEYKVMTYPPGTKPSGMFKDVKSLSDRIDIFDFVSGRKPSVVVPYFGTLITSEPKAKGEIKKPLFVGEIPVGVLAEEFDMRVLERGKTTGSVRKLGLGVKTVSASALDLAQLSELEQITEQLTQQELKNIYAFKSVGGFGRGGGGYGMDVISSGHGLYEPPITGLPPFLLWPKGTGGSGATDTGFGWTEPIYRERKHSLGDLEKELDKLTKGFL